MGNTSLLLQREKPPSTAAEMETPAVTEFFPGMEVEGEVDMGGSAVGTCKWMGGGGSASAIFSLR